MLLNLFGLPEGWRAVAVWVNSKPGTLDSQNPLDLTGQRNRIAVRVTVRQDAP
jgi:hypothetical protein